MLVVGAIYPFFSHITILTSNIQAYNGLELKIHVQFVILQNISWEIHICGNINKDLWLLLKYGRISAKIDNLNIYNLSFYPATQNSIYDQIFKSLSVIR